MIDTMTSAVYCTVRERELYLLALVERQDSYREDSQTVSELVTISVPVDVPGLKAWVLTPVLIDTHRRLVVYCWPTKTQTVMIEGVIIQGNSSRRFQM